MTGRRRLFAPLVVGALALAPACADEADDPDGGSASPLSVPAASSSSTSWSSSSTPAPPSASPDAECEAVLPVARVRDLVGPLVLHAGTAAEVTEAIGGPDADPGVVSWDLACAYAPADVDRRDAFIRATVQVVLEDIDPDAGVVVPADDGLVIGGVPAHLTAPGGPVAFLTLDGPRRSAQVTVGVDPDVDARAAILALGDVIAPAL